MYIMYLRCLPSSKCRFGYVTNTKIKIVIIIDANHSSLRDNEIRAVSIQTKLNILMLIIDYYYYYLKGYYVSC